jgi:hypothetical protein
MSVVANAEDGQRTYRAFELQAEGGEISQRASAAFDSPTIWDGLIALHESDLNQPMAFARGSFNAVMSVEVTAAFGRIRGLVSGA